ncbi:unnamed protein product [Schistosoma curassoni]|uniref:Complement factor properdin n=1 Tax=Schistosoma curassoni TaxID=6186 RepID=A0A183JIE2_9TREM|nr:unnamed protein product [Schistosoma curassoni]
MMSSIMLMWSNYGHGTQSRTRTCICCTAENTEIHPCSVKFCPTDGEWGGWTQRCDSPLPNNGGRSCVGEASPWSPWSDYSSACGTGGTQNRKRTCDNPTPSYGGTSCPGQDLMVRSCNRGPCPINSPVPVYGGEDCTPTGSTETSECQSKACPIHGDWWNWSSWSAYSRTCYVGLQTRERECTQPPPQFDGRLCRGSANKIRSCETQKCGSSGFCPNNELGIISSTHGCLGSAEEIQDCTLDR